MGLCHSEASKGEPSFGRWNIPWWDRGTDPHESSHPPVQDSWLAQAGLEGIVGQPGPGHLRANGHDHQHWTRVPHGLRGSPLRVIRELWADKEISRGRPQLLLSRKQQQMEESTFYFTTTRRKRSIEVPGFDHKNKSDVSAVTLASCSCKKQRCGFMYVCI